MAFSMIYKTDLTDRDLSGFWKRLEGAGRTDNLFYDRAPVSAGEFAWIARDPAFHLWMVSYLGEPAGIFFLTDVQGKAGRAHFAILPTGGRRFEICGRSEAADGRTALRIPLAVGLAGFCLSQSLWRRTKSGGFVLDSLIGITPVCFLPALKLAKRMPYASECVVPDFAFIRETGENAAARIAVYRRDEGAGGIQESWRNW